MGTDADTLKTEMAALEVDVEGILTSYLEVAGWRVLFGVLARLAERRREGRIAGIMQYAVNFLAVKG